MPSISENVWLWIKGKPYVQEALERGIINYSALARVINKEMGGKNFEAVKAALRRMNRKLVKQRKNMEGKVLKILRSSNLEVKNKIAVIISNKRLEIPTIATAKSVSGFTHILEENEMNKIKSKDFLKIRKGLSLITIRSPEKLEETPGVIAYLLSSLAAENINVVEFVSCYKDTLLVFKDSDVLRAFEILSEKLKE
jgi:aspartokinase